MKPYCYAPYSNASTILRLHTCSGIAIAFCIIFLFFGGPTRAQDLSLGIHAGPSICSMPADGSFSNSRYSKPAWSWNGGLEYLNRTRRHFEWGFELNLNSYVEKLRDDSGQSGDAADRFQFYIPSIRYSAGYWNNCGRSRFGVGGSIGLCGGFANPGFRAYTGGLVGGIYFRYGYALNDRVDFTAAVQPSYHEMVASVWGYALLLPLVSFPANFGVAYKF